MFADLCIPSAAHALGGWLVGGLFWQIGDVGRAPEESEALGGVGLLVAVREVRQPLLTSLASVNSLSFLAGVVEWQTHRT